MGGEGREVQGGRKNDARHPATATHTERANNHRDPSVEPLLVENGRHLVELTGEVVTKISYEQFGELGCFPLLRCLPSGD